MKQNLSTKIGFKITVEYECPNIIEYQEFIDIYGENPWVTFAEHMFYDASGNSTSAQVKKIELLKTNFKKPKPQKETYRIKEVSYFDSKFFIVERRVIFNWFKEIKSFESLEKAHRYVSSKFLKEEKELSIKIVARY